MPEADDVTVQPPPAAPSGGAPSEVAPPGSHPRTQPQPTAAARPRRPRGRDRVRAVRERLGRVLRDRWDILLVIAAGGATGSLLRWGLTLLLPHPAGAFAWATFTANVTGAFLLGVLMVFVVDVWPPSRYVRPFWGVGVLGGYTTFSTYMLDARAALVAGRAALAGAYLFGTLAAGLVAVWAGVAAARGAARLRRTRSSR